MMNLQHWRLLVAVADDASITRAAERVGITQSGASQALAQLEAALGLQVFSRERRRIGVTAQGERVVEEARAMLARFDAIRALAAEGRGLSQARLRLASFPSVLSAVLPPLLREFRRRHPGIELVAVEGTDEEVEDWLAAGTVDLGVVLNPEPARQAVVLGHDAWMAVLPLHHPLARRSSALGVRLEELVAEPFVLATGGCSVHGQSLARQAGLELSDVRVTVRDWASACVLVREGLGVALVPASALPGDTPGIRALPLAPAAHRVFGLVCSHTGQASPAAQVLIEALRTQRWHTDSL